MCLSLKVNRGILKFVSWVEKDLNCEALIILLLSSQFLGVKNVELESELKLILESWSTKECLLFLADEDDDDDEKESSTED